MKIEELKPNLNRMVKYGENTDTYMLTAGVIRKNKSGYFYQAELLDTKCGNSVIICRLDDVEGLE